MNFPHRFVSQGRLIRHDSNLGHAFVANVCRRVPHEHGAYFANTNAEGFREDHDLARPPAGMHVMCFGDSYAAGDGVDNAQRFSALLGERLGITVSSVAVPGHGPDQNVLQLEQMSGPPPDLIVWCIAVQTIERIQSQKRMTIDREGRLWQVGRPHFELSSQASLELRGVPVAEQGVELVEPPGASLQSPLAARCSRAAAALRARLVSAVGTYVKPAPDPDYADAQGTGWQLLAAIVRRFHTAAGNVPVAIVPLPTSRYLAEHNEAHFQHRFAELEQPSQGLHVLDVVSGMRSAPRAERSHYNYRLDGHYTETGHVAVASVLSEQLLARGLVADGMRATHVSRSPARRAGAEFVLHVGWSLGEGYAQLRSVASNEIVHECRESEIIGKACRDGVLPLSAVHACLEERRVAGPDLARVVLHSPVSIADLAAFDRDDVRWLRLLAGCVRWQGGAEVDLRSFLCFEGVVAHSDADGEDEMPHVEAVEATDDEWLWLRRHVASLSADLAVTVLRHRIMRLARQWQLVTRSARESVLPTTAPLRRGRMARRLSQKLERDRKGS